jgi:uncharacterized Zn finger protein (UPF0148 family)
LLANAWGIFIECSVVSIIMADGDHLTCPVCEETFETQQELQDHGEQEHQERKSEEGP